MGVLESFHQADGLASKTIAEPERCAAGYLPTSAPWAHLKRFLRLRAVHDGKVDFLPVPLLPPCGIPGLFLSPSSPSPSDTSGSDSFPDDVQENESQLSRLISRLNRQEGNRWYLLTVPFRPGLPVWQSIFPAAEFASLSTWEALSTPLSLLVLLEAIEEEGWRPVLFLRDIPLYDLGAQSLLLQLAQRRLWTGKLPSGTVVLARSGSPSGVGQPPLPTVLHGSVFWL